MNEPAARPNWDSAVAPVTITTPVGSWPSTRRKWSEAFEILRR
jgi:hypothetical protein